MACPLSASRLALSSPPWRGGSGLGGRHRHRFPRMAWGAPPRCLRCVWHFHNALASLTRGACSCRPNVLHLFEVATCAPSARRETERSTPLPDGTPRPGTLAPLALSPRQAGEGPASAGTSGTGRSASGQTRNAHGAGAQHRPSHGPRRRRSRQCRRLAGCAAWRPATGRRKRAACSRTTRRDTRRAEPRFGERGAPDAAPVLECLA